MKLHPVSLRATLPVLLVSAAATAACGASGTETFAEPRAEAPATQPTSTPAPASSGPTAGAPDAATPNTGRAKCGAAAYDWVVSNGLGDVLEQKNLAPHTPLELNYAIVQARKSAFKTRRLARYSTKSRIVRYQTQDRGKLLDATTSVAWPDVSDAKTFPVLLVLHGTAGFNDQCSPSGGIADDLIGSFQDGTAVLLSLFASLGYVVVAPDYLGLKSLGAPTGFLHPYLVAEPTAIASLDSVRAAKKLLAGSNVTAGDLVVVGGSQGGHAAAFVNRFQPHYAPDLPIKGSVWDVPPTNLIGQSVPALTSDQNATKNVMAATTTLESWYQASPNGLAGAFNAPWNTSVPQAMATSCSSGDVLKGASLEAVFTPQYREQGQKPGFGGYQPWACYMLENSLQTTSVPKQDSIPSLVLLAEGDQLVNTQVERDAFQTLCAQGHVLSFLECSEASHTKPLTYAFDQWLDFLEERLDGKPLANACALRPAERCTSQP
jgi:hypothetical protein